MEVRQSGGRNANPAEIGEGTEDGYAAGVGSDPSVWFYRRRAHL